MKKRQSNYELLRIIAMCMIIAMHYFTKGMKFPKLSADAGLGNAFYWLLYSFCTVAVNVYVLISGYFMIDSEWHIGKVIKLWIQVLFYSILIPIVLGALGVIELNLLDFGTWQQVLLPIEYEHYWFATSYVMMYLLAPILVVAIKNLNKNTLKNVIIALLVVFCGFKSVNPYLIPWDKYGCDMPWFIVLFLIAGYIRMYGIEFFNSKKKSIITYVLCSIATFVIAYVLSLFVARTGKLQYYVDMTYCYNYITVLIGSIALFYTFLYMGKDNANGVNGKLDNIIIHIASCTFGIYLLHENIVVRENWFNILGGEALNGSILQVLHMLLCVIVIFVVGIIVELIRQWIFKAFSHINE